MKSTPLAFLAVLAMLHVGCDMKKNDDLQNQITQTVKIKSTTLEDFIKVDVKGADPEKYVVQFSWPVIEDGKTIRIRLLETLAEVSPSQTFFTHIVGHNQNLNYSFDILDQNKKIERSFRKSVQIPYDYVVTGTQSIPDQIMANRVFLTDAAPLFIGNRVIQILTNEIHSSGGEIVTFPQETDGSASLSADLDGGNLFIRSGKLFGRLKITMRGQKGPKGQTGSDTPGRGPTGAPAGRGRFGSSGFGGGAPVCVSPGSDGGPGGKGAKGTVGGVGLQGGATGNVTVQIEQYVPADGAEGLSAGENPLPVEIDMIPGAGGEGGDGGSGQLGGVGGSLNEVCAGKPGPEGPRGDQGDEGPQGPSGLTGKACLYVGSEDYNVCQ